MPHWWKDIRLINADYLVDDSEHHLAEASKRGLETGYILIPGYGSPEDAIAPLKWKDIVLSRVGMG